MGFTASVCSMRRSARRVGYMTVAWLAIASAAPAVDRPVTDAILTVGGDDVGVALGQSIAAGDFDGDGFADLAVGIPLGGGDNAGRVVVYFGPDGNRTLELSGDGTPEQFGFSVANAGDTNGDGRDDLIVGANLNDAAGVNAGRVYIYSGESGQLLRTLDGPEAHAEFGWSVSGAGDVNGDGRSDVVVGAHLSDIGAVNGGSAFVFSGADGGLIHSFHAESEEAIFGWRVAAAGDINGDGFADVMVSATRQDTTEIDAGRVYVYSGADGDLMLTLDGEQADELFGFALAGIEDVDGDGVPDIAVGAIFNNDAGTHAGRVTLYSGADGDAITTVYGEAIADKFGASIASAGDFDGDGAPDLLIGAPGNDGDPSDPIDHAGRAYLVSSVTGRVLGTISGASENEWVGWACAGGGDFDGDGLPDLFIGAPLATHTAPLAGRAYVMSGEAICLADLNADGVVDGADLAILLSAWGQVSVHDLTGDQVIDGADLAALLSAWGSCGG